MSVRAPIGRHRCRRIETLTNSGGRSSIEFRVFSRHSSYLFSSRRRKRLRAILVDISLYTLTMFFSFYEDITSQRMTRRYDNEDINSTLRARLKLVSSYSLLFLSFYSDYSSRTLRLGQSVWKYFTFYTFARDIIPLSFLISQYVFLVSTGYLREVRRKN